MSKKAAAIYAALVLAGGFGISGALLATGAFDHETPAVAAPEPQPEPKAKPKPPKPKSQAEKVASRWATAMANHQWAVACSMETPAYAGPHCPAVYAQSFAQSQAATGLDLVANLHVVARTSKRAREEKFRTVGPNLDGAAIVTVTRQDNGRWMVSNTAGE